MIFQKRKYFKKSIFLRK